MPAVPLRRQSAGDGRGNRADVAGGVQQRETAATRVVVSVQFAEQAADIDLNRP